MNSSAYIFVQETYNQVVIVDETHYVRVCIGMYDNQEGSYYVRKDIINSPFKPLYLSKSSNVIYFNEASYATLECRFLECPSLDMSFDDVVSDEPIRYEALSCKE